MRGVSSHRVVGITALFFGLLAALSTWAGIDWTSTDDRNGDGRPDVWRTYDQAGHLIEVAVDSNFDGRSDVHEYYTGGDLVRRESDRNFDDRVDLVEEFDATTHVPVRATVDTDFDGTADVLTLFEDGRPVYSVRATSGQRAHVEHQQAGTVRRPDGQSPIRAFKDPFAADTTVRSPRSMADSLILASTIPAVFTATPPVVASAALHSRFWPLAAQRLRGRTIVVPAPRGPPAPITVATSLAV